MFYGRFEPFSWRFSRNERNNMCSFENVGDEMIMLIIPRSWAYNGIGLFFFNTINVSNRDSREWISLINSGDWQIDEITWIALSMNSFSQFGLSEHSSILFVSFSVCWIDDIIFVDFWFYFDIFQLIDCVLFSEDKEL